MHYLTPRRLLQFKLVFSLLCCCLLCSAPASADEQEQQLLQQRLEQLYFEGVDKIDQEPLYATAYLHEMYRKNQFKRLWINQDTINQLYAAIADAANEGLNPEDYHLTILQHYAETLQTSPSPTKELEYDILLSDAMILLGQHKRYGKVDPAKVEERHNLESARPHVVPVEIYLSAIENDTVHLMLDQRSSGHQAYVNLKKALKQYREIALKGGWPKVPSGPTLRPGMRGSRVAAIRQRLIATGDYPLQAAQDLDAFDSELTARVKAFQKRHHLEPDGMVGKGTQAAMNISVEERVQQIRVNLERTRWVIHDMPSSSLLVDIAGFMLQYYHNNEEVWTTKVMVGRPYHQTPVFRSAINYMVLNPTWTIPPNIARDETVPSVISDSEALSKRGIRVFDSKGKEVSADSIPWDQYRGRRIPYTLRQDPGPGNSLGKIKFIFSNPYHVYLHDTPSKSLFDRTQRAFSHGCIRVQNPMHLAKMILANDAQNPVTAAKFDSILASGRITTVQLKEPLPIYLIYLTTNIQEGKVLFKPDLYNRDPAVFAALNAKPIKLVQPTPLTEEPVEQAEGATNKAGEPADTKTGGQVDQQSAPSQAPVQAPAIQSGDDDSANAI